MILDAPNRTPPAIGGHATLDDLFRLAAARRADHVALIDPPNRETFADGPARCLTYAQADRIASALAGRLRRIGLSANAIVGIQTVNTVESVLTLLAVLRAGLIAMPLPLLWQRADVATALERVAAGALIVSGRAGEVDQFELAMQVATDVFGLRHVCGFGRNPPDGVIALDDLFDADCPEPALSIAHEPAPSLGSSAHLAAVTWDVTAEGIVPVGRSHVELMAGGLAALLESRIEQDAVILSTMMPSSFAALAVSVLPWLLVGGTLALHQPFDAAVFAAQLTSICCNTAIVPGPLVAQFAESGHLDARLKSVLGLWRAPERLARAPAWHGTSTAMIDVQVFGEAGLIAARRGEDGKPVAIPFGPLRAPHDINDALRVAEIRPTANGTLAVRGPMVPRCAFPPGAEKTALPRLKVAADGFVDTGYSCPADRSTMTITAPPPGIVSVGGYRFVMRGLEDLVAGIDGTAALAALPDAVAGHRLAGSARDRGRMEEALTAMGAHRLLAGAFH